MEKEVAIRNRSLGEAHLYVAVAKADGVVSSAERLGAPRLARKSQQVLDVLKLNKPVKARIGGDITAILDDPAFANWSAEEHIDQAMKYLRKARDAGGWDTEYTFHRNEDGLRGLAFMDGYIFKESRLISEIENRLKEFA
jgi:hypothetical protein